MKNLPSKNRISEEEFQQIKNNKLDASAEAPEPLEREGYERIRLNFIDNWIHNKNPHSYSFIDETYELDHLIKSYCPKHYKILFKPFYLQYPSSVETHFSNTLKEKKEELIDKFKL